MLIYSVVTMRDLMRNYRMLLKRKNESDTENEPLMSSASSSQSFGTIKEPCIFKQDSYSTESDPENPPQDPLDRRKATKKHDFTFESNFTSFRGFGGGNSIINRDDSMPGKQQDNSMIDYKDNEEPASTNNSLVTIFAIWNTTMGSSLLAMAWGLEKTGLFPGIIINILIAGLCLYTAYILLNVNEKHGMIDQVVEVSYLCKMLLGVWSEYLAKSFSLIVLIGANIVYWILMSNFLYNSVYFLYEYLTVPTKVLDPNLTVVCPRELNQTLQVGTPLDEIWRQYSTVPVFLALIMFPMLNFKSATFFTKFNSLGTFSVIYLLFFVALRASQWGFSIPNWSIEWTIKPTFCALTGMLSLSYFIHNIIIQVMRNNKHPQHNGRDLSIAFGLITFTYLFIGVLFYATFPLKKSCIEDNILNNFDKRDVLTVFARILLLFQLFTVFPLMSYMLRVEILANINAIFKNYRFGDFTYTRVMLINSVILLICILFACFMPRIGTLIRYTGALSGLVYIFVLPSLLKIASLRKEGSLTPTKLIIYIIIIVIGVVNLFSQFFISD